MSGHDWWQRGAEKSHKPGGATNVAPSTAPATPGKQTLVDTAHAAAPDRRPSEALQHLRAGEVTLDTLCAMGEILEDQARSADSAPVVAFARTIVPMHRSVIGALTAVFRMVREYDHEVSEETQRPIATVAAETLRVPGMQKALERVTSKLAQYVSTMDAVRAKHPQVNALLSGSGYGTMLHMLNRVRGNFDLEWFTRESLKSLVEVEVVSSSAVVDLGGITAPDWIQNAVSTVAHAWDHRVNHFALAVGEFVHLIQHEELEKFDWGLTDKLWSVAKKLLTRGAAYVTGTPLGATVGFAVVEKMQDYQKALEQARERADEQDFIKELQRRVTALQLEGIAPGGNQHIQEWVIKLNKEFTDLAKRDPSAHEGNTYKLGDVGVMGAQAEFLRTLDTGAKGYMASVPPQQAFTAEFLMEWVNANHKSERSGGATHWDGYIGCKVELGRYGSAWAITPNSSATMHCPRSEAVAREMMRTIDPFNVRKSGCPVHIEVTCSDRDELPPFMRDHVPLTVRLNSQHEVDGPGWHRAAWEWVQQATGDTDDVILQRFRKLSG